jgi:diacylglycerol O-acyltransferase
MGGSLGVLVSTTWGSAVQRLTGLDATFLYMETPSSHMHVASTIILDPSTAPQGYTFEKARALVENRLPLLPPFRRRLVEVPFGLHHPIWIEDPDFDLDYHIRRAALPAPGGRKELEEFASDVMGRPLDRTRPLWEMYIVEGLEDGNIAVVTKTHHAAIDGVSGAEMTVNLLDLTPEAAIIPPPDPEWKPDRVPTDLEMVGYAVNSLARQPLAAIKAVRRTAEMALNLRRRNRQPNVNAPPAPFQAPKTFFNTTITAHRRFVTTEVSLDDVKLIKNALGGTVNDVVLATCAGALRSWLADHGELPDEDLVGMVPISVRTEDQMGSMGNRVSGMLVRLVTSIDDPVKRLEAVREATKDAKEQDKAIGADTLSNWTEFAAPAVAARAARLASSLRVWDRLARPLFNVVISNVPGPNIPLYSAGARVLGIWPMGPITDGAGLNITVMSYMGSVNFGLVACREVAPDLDALAGYISESLENLLKAASAVAQPASSAAKAAAKPRAKPAARPATKAKASRKKASARQT